MIKKLWIKFYDDDLIECWCEPNRKKCPPEKKPECRAYVVKFIEVVKEDGYENVINRVNKESRIRGELLKKIKREQKKLQTQVEKSIKKFKI